MFFSEWYHTFQVRPSQGREWQIIEISNPLVALGAIEMLDPFRIISFLSLKSS
ncbi:hypothetical protein B879_04201 [Cecembia lonarensis LW9]|uniref:Uncharacterized protein n=1 Tax=Cecembia lonarensis (strain CCUG 58316 / KCTC 22772 / LW9) TaxID=1225176 RepID=K1KSR8_CECL9|nr:hypothetical protein B879_04201 [Cecembia lonarensis LW9]